MRNLPVNPSGTVLAKDGLSLFPCSNIHTLSSSFLEFLALVLSWTMSDFTTSSPRQEWLNKPVRTCLITLCQRSWLMALSTRRQFVLNYHLSNITSSCNHGCPSYSPHSSHSVTTPLPLSKRRATCHIRYTKLPESISAILF